VNYSGRTNKRQLFDVREDDEFKLGLAPDALRIPLAEVPDHLKGLPKDRAIVAVCRSRGRSSRAGQFLLEQGFDVVNLEGGMSAWAQQGAPLEATNGDPMIG
jgi:rhodanese-related sulfurtransferase